MLKRVVELPQERFQGRRDRAAAGGLSWGGDTSERGFELDGQESPSAASIQPARSLMPASLSARRWRSAVRSSGLEIARARCQNWRNSRRSRLSTAARRTLISLFV